MFGLFIGALFGSVVGFVAGRSSSSSPSSSPSGTTVSAELSRWTGTVGTIPVEVFRNGPSWAWKTQVNAGAEPTALAALRAALRLIFEATPGATSDIDLARGDDAVHGAVRYSANDAETPWHWLMNIRDGAGELTIAALGKAKTRGVAALEMLDKLAPYTVPA